MLPSSLPEIKYDVPSPPTVERYRPNPTYPGLPVGRIVSKVESVKIRPVILDDSDNEHPPALPRPLHTPPRQRKRYHEWEEKYPSTRSGATRKNASKIKVRKEQRLAAHNLEEDSESSDSCKKIRRPSGKKRGGKRIQSAPHTRVCRRTEEHLGGPVDEIRYKFVQPLPHSLPRRKSSLDFRVSYVQKDMTSIPQADLGQPPEPLLIDAKSQSLRTNSLQLLGYDTSKPTCAINLVCYRSGPGGCEMRQIQAIKKDRFEDESIFLKIMKENPDWVLTDHQFFCRLRQVYLTEMCGLWRRSLSLKSLRRIRLLVVRWSPTPFIDIGIDQAVHANNPARANSTLRYHPSRNPLRVPQPV